MSTSRKPSDSSAAGFWLNPNVVAKMQSGFRACLQQPIRIREPEADFADTIPGEWADLAKEKDPSGGVH